MLLISVGTYIFVSCLQYHHQKLIVWYVMYIQGSAGGLFEKFCFFFVTGGLRVILLAQAKEMCLRGYVAIPGYKLCPPCQARYAKLAKHEKHLILSVYPHVRKEMCKQ